MPKSSEHDTVYKCEPHSIMKHKILESYLTPWFHILSKYNPVVQYVDCFAGAGEYDDSKTTGSPIIALKCLNEHKLKDEMFLRSSFNFVFIEKEADRAAALQKTVDSMSLHKRITVGVINDTFENEMEKLYGTEDSPKHTNLAPTFAFIDPFGYSQIPMRYVRRILETPKCEVLVNVMVDFAKRFSFSGMQDTALDRLFGCHDWAGVLDIPEDRKEERNEFLMNLYIRELTKNLDKGFKFTLQFKMINKMGRESYRLLFATKNALGFELMKESMYKADERGSYTFDDRLAGISYLVNYMEEKIWVEDAANNLSKTFKGKIILGKSLKKHIIEETGWIYRASILKRLEEKGHIQIDGRQRRNTYPDDCKIKFIG